MKSSELYPVDGRKSFYGKCRVEITTTGSEILLSYNTPIIRRYRSGRMVRLFDGWTATTGRHVKAFCGLNKKDFFSLPLSK